MQHRKGSCFATATYFCCGDGRLLDCKVAIVYLAGFKQAESEELVDRGLHCFNANFIILSGSGVSVNRFARILQKYPVAAVVCDWQPFERSLSACGGVT